MGTVDVEPERWPITLTASLLGICLLLGALILAAYFTIRSFDPGPSCNELINRALGAEPSEHVRLMEEADQRDCLPSN